MRLLLEENLKIGKYVLLVLRVLIVYSYNINFQYYIVPNYLDCYIMLRQSSYFFYYGLVKGVDRAAELCLNSIIVLH
jgi:hypothetical protein